MAENEELDLGKSLRWRRVLNAVLDDKPADEIAALVVVCLRLSVNALRRPVFGGCSPQVPLADLLDAIGTPCEVDRIVRGCGRHDYAQLFRDSTVDAKTRREGSESFLDGICEKCFDQIKMKTVQTDGYHTFPHVRSRLDEVKALIKPDVKRIAQQLAANPSASLRRPRSSGRSGTGINTQSVLSESLLGD